METVPFSSDSSSYHNSFKCHHRTATAAGLCGILRKVPRQTRDRKLTWFPDMSFKLGTRDVEETRKSSREAAERLRSTPEICPWPSAEH